MWSDKKHKIYKEASCLVVISLQWIAIKWKLLNRNLNHNWPSEWLKKHDGKGI